MASVKSEIAKGEASSPEQLFLEKPFGAKVDLLVGDKALLSLKKCLSMSIDVLNAN